MKIVRMKNNIVVEVLPEFARPLEDYYNEEFIQNCTNAPDEVRCHWTFDKTNNKWFPPNNKVPTTIANIIRIGINNV